MKRVLQTLVVLLLTPLAACEYHKLQQINYAEPAGDPFQKALWANYRTLTHEEERNYDWEQAVAYADKALRSAYGEDVLPEDPTGWELPDSLVKQFEKAREDLLAIIAGDARAVRPQLVADAQTNYDCWLEHQSENTHPSDIAQCRDAFYAAMQELLMPEPASEEPKKVKRTVKHVVKKPAPKPAPAPVKEELKPEPVMAPVKEEPKPEPVKEEPKSEFKPEPVAMPVKEEPKPAPAPVKEEPKPEPKPEPVAAPVKEEPKPEPKVETTPAPAPASEVKAEPTPTSAPAMEAKYAPAPEAKPEAAAAAPEPTPTPAPPPASTVETKSESAAVPVTEAAPAPAATAAPEAKPEAIPAASPAPLTEEPNKLPTAPFNPPKEEKKEEKKSSEIPETPATTKPQSALSKPAKPGENASYMVFFDAGQAALNPTAEKIVDAAAQSLLKHKSYRVVVNARNDLFGNVQSGLPEQRAQMVKNRLILSGVAENSIDILAKEASPAAGPGNGQPVERRVEIYISE